MLRRAMQAEPEVHQSSVLTDARTWLLALAAVQFIILIGFIFAHPVPPHYDEPWYLGTVKLLHEKGLSRQFLLDLPGPAGPLYTLVHAVFEPITHLRPPAVRLVNPLLLILTMGATYAALRRRDSADAASGTVAMLGVPMTWVICGMALTEMPAMLFVALSVLMLVMAFHEDPSGAMRLVWAALGGLFLGIAVLGRQPYLVLLGGLPLLVRDIRRDVPVIGVFAALTVAVTAPVFLVWRGMVPPTITEVGKGIAWHHGLWSFCYGAVIVLLLAPRFLRLGWAEWAVVIVAAVCVSFLVPGQLIPMQTVARRALPASLLPLGQRMTAIGACAIALAFGLACVRRGLENRRDRVFIALLTGAGLLLLTPMKITHVFSSRYVVMALPLLVVVADRYTASNYWKVLRLALGSVLGFLSLLSYFSLASAGAGH
jgi:hypothetical protein